MIFFPIPWTEVGFPTRLFSDRSVVNLREAESKPNLTSPLTKTYSVFESFEDNAAQE